MNIKDIPLKVLTELKPFLEKRGRLFYRLPRTERYLVRYNDADRTSKFFFEINGHQTNIPGSLHFKVTYSPKNDGNNDASTSWVEPKAALNLLEMWVDRLGKYEVAKDPMDVDEIVKQYEEDFYTEYEIVDEDADVKSYDYKTQLLIEAYLETVTETLEQYKNSDNQLEIEEIKREVEELKKTQTRLTKRVIVKKLFKILARTQKASLSAFKSVIKVFKEVMVKKIVEYAIDNAGHIAHSIGDSTHQMGTMIDAAINNIT